MTSPFSSIISSFFATSGSNEPWSRIENSTIIKTIWNTSFSVSTAISAIIANTMDAAPLKPAHDTRSCWEIFPLNGVSTSATATGLATNVRNTAIKSAGITTCGSLDGNARSPSRKKMSICINPVSPSKKFTRFRLLRISVFPSTIPTI